MLEIIRFETPFAIYGWIGIVGALLMICGVWAASCARIFGLFDRRR